MEIVLLEQVRGLGALGDRVKVKNGYGRNYLIPKGKALLATKDNVAYFEAKRQEIEAEQSKKQQGAEALQSKIEGAVVVLLQHAGEDGRLYGSVSTGDIARALTEALPGLSEITRKQIVLAQPIKYIGVYSVEVGLYGNVVATIHANVARSESEAKEAEARFKRGEVVMEGPGQNDHAEEEAALAEAEAETAALAADHASDAATAGEEAEASAASEADADAGDAAEAPAVQAEGKEA